MKTGSVKDNAVPSSWRLVNSNEEYRCHLPQSLSHEWMMHGAVVRTLKEDWQACDKYLHVMLYCLLSYKYYEMNSELKKLHFIVGPGQRPGSDSRYEEVFVMLNKTLQIVVVDQAK